MVKVRITLSPAPKVAENVQQLQAIIEQWVKNSIVGSIHEVLNDQDEAIDEVYFVPNDEVEGSWKVEVFE